MPHLFKKAAVMGDIHFGNKVNGLVHNQDCLNFIHWFINTAQENGCETCFFLGDYFHNRNSTNLVTMNYGIQGLRLLGDAFEKTYVLTGNHDQFFKTTRDIHSVEWAKHIPNVEVINDITCIGDVLLLPWLVNDEYQHVNEYAATYVFSHLELPTFIMTGNMEMPDVGEIQVKYFEKYKHVYTGHFHKRQTKGNITYIGNAFPHNFGDANDDNRGMMILPWGEEPQFISWPDAPKYRVVKLSELVTDPAQYLPEFGYIKLILDTNISYSEASYLKETLIEEFQLRELNLVPMKKDLHSIDFSNNSNIQLQSVDEIVQNQIMDIESEFYEKNMLLDIYRGL